MKFKIRAAPPFDFALSALIFSNGDRQIRRYEDGRCWRVVRVNGKLVLTSVKSFGNVDEPKLSVELRSDTELSNKDRAMAEEKVKILFNLELDIKPFCREVKGDPVMSKLVRKLKGLKSPTTETAFEALSDSIVEQQISLNVAHILEDNLIKSFGDRLMLGDEVYYAYPTPQRLSSTTVEQLRGCGLTLRKAEYIRDVSVLIVHGKLDLEKFKKYNDTSEIIRELCQIRGVGVWTAEITAVRGMQKLDAMPAEDVGLRRSISHFYCNDRRISAEEAREIAEKWGKWKSLAGFYLEIAERLGVEN